MDKVDRWIGGKLILYYLQLFKSNILVYSKCFNSTF